MTLKNIKTGTVKKNKLITLIIIITFILISLIGIRLFFNRNNNILCDKEVRTYQKIYEYESNIEENISIAFLNFAINLSNQEDNISSCNLISYHRIYDNQYRVDVRCYDGKVDDDVYFTNDLYIKNNSLYYVKSSILQGCNSNYTDGYIDQVESLSEYMGRERKDLLRDNEVEISTNWFWVDIRKFESEEIIKENYVVASSDKKYIKSLGFEDICIDCEIGPIYAYIKYNNDYYIKTTVLKSKGDEIPYFLNDKNYPGFPDQINELNMLFNKKNTFITEDGNGIVIADYCYTSYPNVEGKKNYYLSISNVGTCPIVN